MNKARRKALREAEELLRQAQEIITTAHDEEEQYLDDMPQNMADGARYEQVQGNIDCLSEARDAIDEIVDTHIAGAIGE